MWNLDVLGHIIARRLCRLMTLSPRTISPLQDDRPQQTGTPCNEFSTRCKLKSGAQRFFVLALLFLSLTGVQAIGLTTTATATEAARLTATHFSASSLNFTIDFTDSNGNGLLDFDEIDSFPGITFDGTFHKNIIGIPTIPNISVGNTNDNVWTFRVEGGNTTTRVLVRAYNTEITFAPTLTEVTAVATPTNDSTPTVVIKSDQAGTLTYNSATGGTPCNGSESSIAADTDTTITLRFDGNGSPYPDGTYSDCTITVTNTIGLASDTLTLSSFTVDTTAPTANAGSDLTASAGATVTLDGTGSSDADSGVGSYTWTQVTSDGGDTAASSPVSLDLTNPDQPTFTGPSFSTDTDLFFKLTVTDNAGNSHDDWVAVTVNADTTTPTLTITSSDGFLAVGETATLTFTFSEDVTGFELADITSGSGTVSNLSTGSIVNGEEIFTATFTPSAGFEGDVTISVADGSYTDGANDGIGDSLELEVDLTAPTASASSNTSQTSGTTGELYSTGSTDTGSGIASYAWEQVDALNSDTSLPSSDANYVTLSGADLSQASFTVPIVAADTNLYFKLTVTDNAGNSASTWTTFAAIPDNTAPTVTSITRGDPTEEVTNASTAITPNTLLFAVTFSEAIDPNTISASDFSVSIAGNSYTPVIAPDGNTPTNLYLVRVDLSRLGTSPQTGATVDLDIATTSIKDRGGNLLSSGTPTGEEQTYTWDNAAPALTIASNTIVVAGATVALGDTVSTTDTDVASWEWVQVNGSSLTANVVSPGDFTITDLDQTDKDASFIAPTPSVVTTYFVRVTATDTAGNASMAVARVTVELDTTDPVAVITTNSPGSAGGEGTLDGTSSSDIGSGIASLAWVQVDALNSDTPATLNTVSLTIPSPGKATFTVPSLAADTNLYFKLTVTDSAGNSNSAWTTYTVTANTTAPTLSEVTAVTTPTNDNTPEVVIRSTQAGTLTYNSATGGTPCNGSESSITADTDTTITLRFDSSGSPYPNGTYSDCTITVTNTIGLASNTLTLSSFTVDSTAPTVSRIVRLTPSNEVTNANTLLFHVTFSEAIDPATISASDFSVSVNGNSYTPSIIEDSSTSTNNLYIVQVNLSSLGTSPQTGTTVDLNIATTSIKDRAGNLLSSGTPTGQEQTYTWDNAAPTLSVVTQVPTPTSDGTPNITINANEGGTVAIGGSCAGNVSSITANTNTTVTLSAAAGGNLAVGTYSDCTVTVTDAAGNASSTVTLDSFEIEADTTAPTVSSVVFQNSSGTEITSANPGESFKVVVTFSEAMDTDSNGTSPPSITFHDATGGTGNNVGLPNWDQTGLDGWSSGDTVYTFNYTAPSTLSTSVTVRSTTISSISDASGNALSNHTENDSFDVLENTPPTLVSIKRSSPATENTNASSVTFAVTFSEAVDPSTFADTDIALTQTPANTFAGSSIGTPMSTDNTTFTVTVSGLAGDGTVGLSLASGAVTGADGNPATLTDPTGTNNETYNVDTVAPTLVSIKRSSPTTENTNASSVTFAVTFSEAVDPSTFADTDIALAQTPANTFAGSSIGTPTTTDNTIFTVTVSGLAGDGTVGLSLASGAVTGADGNPATLTDPTGTNNETYNVDTVAPTVTSLTTTTTNPNGPFTITVVFSETVTGFDATDLDVGNGSAGAPSEVAPNDGTTYEVVITPDDGIEDDVTVQILANAVSDSLNGNLVSSSYSFTIDTLEPTIVITADNTALGTGQTAVVTFTLSETSTNFEEGDITVTGGTLSDFAGSGTIYTATFAPTLGAANPGGTGTIQVAANTFTDSFDNPNEASNELVIDFSSAIRQRTQRIISNFMTRRGDAIVSNQPDYTERLNQSGQGGSGAGASFSGEGSYSNNRMNFATSLRQMLSANKAKKDAQVNELTELMKLGLQSKGTQSLGLRSNLATNDGAPAGFDLWVRGRWARYENDTNEGDLGLLFIGADYKFNDGLVIGVVAQFDWTDESDSTEDFKINGRGWMVGPYLVAQLHQNLIFDANFSWGKSDNEVSPFNTYTDSFDGTRWLASAKFTGSFKFGHLHVAPHIGVLYFQERQEAYVDSLSIDIPSQTVKLGRLTFGPKISATIKRKDGTTISPYVGIKGLWDFERSQIVDLTTGLAAESTDDLRARVDAGVSIRLPDGLTLNGEGFYDGLGAKDYKSYGGSIRLNIPLQRDSSVSDAMKLGVRAGRAQSAERN